MFGLKSIVENARARYTRDIEEIRRAIKVVADAIKIASVVDLWDELRKNGIVAENIEVDVAADYRTSITVYLGNTVIEVTIVNGTIYAVGYRDYRVDGENTLFRELEIEYKTIANALQSATLIDAVLWMNKVVYSASREMFTMFVDEDVVIEVEKDMIRLYVFMEIR